MSEATNDSTVTPAPAPTPTLHPIATPSLTLPPTHTPSSTATATATPLLIPVFVLASAVLLWVLFQSYSLFNERQALLAAAAQLAPQAETATKVRASIDSIAAGVKRLADGGNANARVIVDELARRGVTINPNSAPTGSATK